MEGKGTSGRERGIDRAGSELFDVAVIGGGIHGAAAARIAAEQGLSVVLLERGDFACGTSSRSSKMAHGGLRYLELLDFEQVFEGIKAREELFDAAPNLVRPQHFLIPVPDGDWFFRAKMKIGLVLYDLMVKHAARKHRWIPRNRLQAPGYDSSRTDLMGCFQYTDGILEDTRLVIDNILAARGSGAVCLNHVGVSALSERQGVVELCASDTLTAKQLVVHARTALNCAGPWVDTVMEASGGNGVGLRFSRGVHLLFDRPWNGPSLFLPMEGKARYYFVWPHFGGTLVGTTERDVDAAETDPLPHPDEVEEILTRLQRDLPGIGLDRNSLHYAFAGVRTLPLRGKKGETARLSRKHIWKKQGPVLSLYGGKYTTSNWTAREGVQLVLQTLKKEKSSSQPVILPSAIRSSTDYQALEQELRVAGLDQPTVSRLLARYGPRVRRLMVYPHWSERIHPFALRGELSLVLDEECAETVEDVLRRRLMLEYLPGNGLEALDAVCEILVVRGVPREAVSRQARQYRDRLGRLRDLISPPRQSMPTEKPVSEVAAV